MEREGERERRPFCASNGAKKRGWLLVVYWKEGDEAMPVRPRPLTWLRLPPSLPLSLGFTFALAARSLARPPVARKVDLCLYLDLDRGSRPIKTRTAAAEAAAKNEGEGRQ